MTHGVKRDIVTNRVFFVVSTINSLIQVAVKHGVESHELLHKKLLLACNVFCSYQYLGHHQLIPCMAERPCLQKLR